MRKVFIPTIIIMFLGIISFIIFTKASLSIPEDSAIKIGEEKYLEFLWLVDGAFDNSEYIVNGRKLEEKVFSCKYKNNNECIGNNFEIEFSNLFSKNINYDKVYSDGIMYSWYHYENGKNIFNYMDNCSINKMPLEQNIKLISINGDKIFYKVSFVNNQKREIEERDFVLVYEDNKWKINTAFYYDICGIKYYIY